MLKLKKNYALLHSSSDGLYEFTDDDVERMHEVLLSIYDDIYAYCEKHSLKLIKNHLVVIVTIVCILKNELNLWTMCLPL